MIQGESKVIKKFLKVGTFITVYIRELQGLQDSLSYSLAEN